MWEEQYNRRRPVGIREQSARSLRGTEWMMSFFRNFQTTPHGMAEVSLTFDNRRRVLSLPYEEISITRRVYRSGKGNILSINNYAACVISESFLLSVVSAERLFLLLPRVRLTSLHWCALKKEGFLSKKLLV